jgi:hypothetical protein
MLSSPKRLQMFESWPYQDNQLTQPGLFFIILAYRFDGGSIAQALLNHIKKELKQ